MSDQKAAAASSGDAPNAKKPKSFLRKLAYAAVAVVVIVVLLLAIAPMGAGSLATGIAQDAINEQITGRVTIDSVSLGWGSGQTVTGITVYDPDGKKVASLDELRTDLSLLGAIFGSLDLGETVGKGLTADIVVADDGTNNLMRAIAMRNPTPPSKDPTVLPTALGIRFRLVDSKAITVTAPGVDKVVIDDLHVELDAPKITDPITLKVTGKTGQGDTHGTLDVDGKVGGAVAPDGTLVADADHLDKLDVSLNVKATDLPVDGVDAMLEQRGLITAALGNKMTVATSVASATGGRFDVTLTATSPNLDASLNTQLTSDMKASGSGSVTLTATPALSTAMAKLNPEAGAPIALTKPVPVKVTIEHFAADLNNVAPNTLAAKASVTAEGDVPLAGDKSLEGVIVRNPSASIDTANLAGAATLALNAELVTPDGPGTVNVGGKVDGLFAAGWTPKFDKAKVNVTSVLKHAPVALVDRMAMLEGMATEALGPMVDVEAKVMSADAGHVDVTLHAKSQHLAADWSGQLGGDKLRATGSGKVVQTVTPGLVAVLAKRADNNDLKLVRPVTLTITIDKLDAMLEDMTPAALAAGLSFGADGDVVLAGDPKLGDMTISGLSGSFSTPGLNKSMTVALKGAARTKDGTGDVKVDGTISDLFTTSWSPNLQTMKANVTAHAKDLPTALLDGVAQQDGVLVEALGARVNLDVTSKSTGADAAEVAVKLTSPRLTANPTLSLNAKAKTITLTGPADVSMEVTRGLFERFVAKESGLAMHGDSMHVTLSLAKLDAPLPGETNGKADPVFQPSRTTIDAEVTELRDLDVDVASLGPGGGVAIDGLSAFLTGPLDKLALNLAGRAHARSDKGEYARALGGPVDLWAHVETGLNDDSSLKPLTVTKVSATSPLLEAKVAGVKADGNFAAAELSGAKITYKLQPVTLTDFGVVEPGGVTIAEPMTLTITAPSIKAALAEFALSKVSLTADASFDKAVLAGDEQVAGASIRDATTKLSFDGAGGVATVNLTGKAGVRGQAEPGPLNIDLKAAKLIGADGALAMDAADVNTTVKLGGLPTGFVEAVTGQSGKLTSVVGASVNVDATAQLAGLSQPRGTMDLKLTTPSKQMTLDAALKLGEVVTLAKPATMRMQLTPAAWKVWIEPALTPAPVASADGAAAKPAAPAPALTLVEPTWINATIESLSWPMPAPAAKPDVVAKTAATPTASPAASEGASTPAAPPIDLSKVAIKANASAEQPVIIEGGADAQRVALTDLRLTASAVNLTQPLTVTLDSGIKPVSKDGASLPPTLAAPGALNVKAVLTDAVTPTLEVNTNTLSADVTVTGTQLPTAMVDQVLQQGGFVRAALGPRTDVNVTTKLAKMNGPLDIKLKSTYAEANIAGQLNAGFLELREDARMKLTVTDKLSRHFLNHPLLKQVVKSEEPIDVVAYKQNFRVPLGLDGKPFDITKVSIDKLTVDPRKMVVKNAGLIKTLLELPTKISSIKGGKFGALFGSDELKAWFTPVDISMKDGVATYSRMDMLIGDDYQVATWGTMNLATQPRTVNGVQMPAEYGNMVLGIDERALRKVYGITQWITDPNYVDQFVMKGKLETLGPDTGDMLGRLTLLTAEGATGAVAGKAGDIIGLVRKTLSTADKELLGRKFDPAPAPRKPFPWPEQEYTDKEKELIQKRTGAQADPNQPQTQPTQPTQTTEPEKPKESPEDKLIKEGLKKLFGK
ncbi:MAG: hypothetical protein GC159_04705 [Phycisphaera sp.]|nr:hypothetical protein [Phycisphaera sp.]